MDQSDRAPRVAWLFSALFLLVLGLHWIWRTLDEMPPVWDMAHHQLLAWAYLQAFRDGSWWTAFPFVSQYYPPLYHCVAALFLCITDSKVTWPLLANLPGMFLLAFSTYRLGVHLLDPLSARLAGITTLLFPLVAWTSRETLLDVSLSGWVAAFVCLALKTDRLQKKNWTLALGLFGAAGILTKWTFPIFVLGPLIMLLWVAPNRRRALLNLTDAGLLAAPAVLWWYLPNLSSLQERFALTREAAAWEGDPSFLTLAGLVYYPRCLSSYYLFLPLTGLLIWGIWVAVRRLKGKNAFHIRYLLGWLLTGLILLTLMDAKDPRYVMPLVTPVALLLYLPFSGRLIPASGVLAGAFVQFILISFPVFTQPVKLALFEIEGDRNYRTLRQEWVWFQTAYFDVAGPPRRENWRYVEILAALSSATRVGFVPEHPHFHSGALELTSVERGHRLEVIRLGHSEESASWVDTLDAIVGKTLDQGIGYLTKYNAVVYEALEGQGWGVRGEWSLPDGSVALVWMPRADQNEDQKSPRAGVREGH